MKSADKWGPASHGFPKLCAMLRGTLELLKRKPQAKPGLGLRHQIGAQYLIQLQLQLPSEMWSQLVSQESSGQHQWANLSHGPCLSPPPKEDKVVHLRTPPVFRPRGGDLAWNNNLLALPSFLQKLSIL